jgi:hypothetical protein
MLDPLEAAVRDESFVRDLEESVRGCHVLTDSQRHHLCHGLWHANRGEWLDACPPLLNGLEGAFWSLAREREVVDGRRFLVTQPSKPVSGVESLFKHLRAPSEYVTFLKRQVFGTTGNPFATAMRRRAKLQREEQEQLDPNSFEDPLDFYEHAARRGKAS